jgi:fatty acid desaturase
LTIPQQTIEQLRSQVEQVTAALERATRERDEATRQRDDAIAAHGAALVMRGAARAGPSHASHGSWWRQALAVLMLIAVIFAILIVAHVL